MVTIKMIMPPNTKGDTLAARLKYREINMAAMKENDRMASS
jgi:hypothetical protein